MERIGNWNHSGISRAAPIAKAGRIPIYNNHNSEIPPFGVVELEELDTSLASSTHMHYKVKRPTADSLSGAFVIFTEGHALPYQKRAQGNLLMQPMCAAYDPEDGDPEVGDDMGTKADSYLLSKGKSGFKCVGVNTTEELCWVRPFSVSLMDRARDYNTSGANGSWRDTTAVSSTLRETAWYDFYLPSLTPTIKESGFIFNFGTAGGYDSRNMFSMDMGSQTVLSSPGTYALSVFFWLMDEEEEPEEYTGGFQHEYVFEWTSNAASTAYDQRICACFQASGYMLTAKKFKLRLYSTTSISSCKLRVYNFWSFGSMPPLTV